MTTASATADEHRILTDIGDQFKRRPLIQGLYCLDESLQESGNLGPSAFPFDAHRSRLSERQIQAQVETLTQNWAAMDQRTRIVGIGMDFFSEFSSSYAGGLTQTAMQALRVGPTGRLLMGLGTAAFKVAVEEKKNQLLRILSGTATKFSSSNSRISTANTTT